MSCRLWEGWFRSTCAREQAAAWQQQQVPLSHTHTAYWQHKVKDYVTVAFYSAYNTGWSLLWKLINASTSIFSTAGWWTTEAKTEKGSPDKETLTTPCLHLLRAGPKHKLRDRRTGGGGGTPLGHIYTASVLCSFKNDLWRQVWKTWFVESRTVTGSSIHWNLAHFSSRAWVRESVKSD